MLVVTGAGLAILRPRPVRHRRRHQRRRQGLRWCSRSACSCWPASCAGWLAGYYQSYLSSWVGERVLLDLRTDTFRHLMRLELGYHERTPTGRTVSRLTSDIEALNQLVTDE